MPDISLIDAHCHLDFPAFDADRDQVLQRAREQHVQHIVIPGTQAPLWPRITQLCEQHSHLHACYGLHPYWSTQHREQDLESLKDYLDTHPAVAIGECGLDFRPQQAATEQDRQRQLAFFEGQLALAQTTGLPLVIHAVRATEAVIQCIQSYRSVHGMIHSYSGSLEQAKQLIDLGFCISISGAVTRDNAKKIRQVVQAIPLEKLLLETDAPDQPDDKHRGQRNEPAFLLNTLMAVAELRKESAEQIARQTSENARRLFTLKS